jgi:hypothetical protein
MAKLGRWGAGALLILGAAGAAQADVEISNKPTVNIACASGICTPMAKKAVLNATELAGMLASGDVTVNTAGGLAGNIGISAALSWASTSRLTLDAYQSVTVTKPVSVTGTGALTIATDDGGSGGDLTFDGKGRVVFWDLASSLVINGQSFTLVKTLDQLRDALKADVEGAYALADNYNAKRKVFKKAAIQEVDGIFEGLGNVISNFHISTADDKPPPLALIRDNEGGTIRDLGLTNMNLDGGGGVIGGLVYVNGGTVQNCYATGTVKGAWAGGLVANNVGVVRHSHASAAVTGTSTDGEAGGLVAGSGPHGTIETSYATGSVSGAYAGGLIGVNEGVIDQTYATGAVSPLGGAAGGSVGLNEGTVANSYATGEIGGGAGAIGVNEGFGVSESYSTGHVDAGDAGFVFQDITQNFSDCYWDLDTSGVGDPHEGAGNIPDDPGITGLTTAQFQSGLPAGFDPAIWAEKPGVNGGYPYLKALPPG